MTLITRFTNCRVLRNGKLIRDDLYVRDGKIIDYMQIFYEERRKCDIALDCKGRIIAPGFIDLQINGGFGYDFSHDCEKIESAVREVAQRLLSSGVIGFCPTLVTSDPAVYPEVLKKIRKETGGKHGAAILGLHLEGPFIAMDKRGAHNPSYVRTLENGVCDLTDVYGNDLSSVAIVTLAPELDIRREVIKYLSSRGVRVALGHSTASLRDAEIGASNGASLITHLFNAMPLFHHRDPGVVGLLTSEVSPRPLFYGIIADGVHTHFETLRIAHRINPQNLVLVTDAISAMGLENGKHFIGDMQVVIEGKRATIDGTSTLCGCVSSLDFCVRQFHAASGCSIEEALEAASLHPAQALGLANKGSLDVGSDADFVIVNDDIQIQSTWIAGEMVYSL
ncbi:N-acetylglucosamine-6-phosphate deacetylase [Galendromus occidentalis]|uniref:N-acetylglucosamine-6-phosphate deacetylase n=1 Tax=Galendromus occidentalis TaxID=34638 RepID=A0AAJ6QQT1_9ACAR|nr:N-acetylglucosamine-6-phosphate deacetylase [Galendromus occidentalis]